MNNNPPTPRIGKGGHHNKVASELLKELQELKDYDENLRQKTISLLKGQHWFHMLYLFIEYYLNSLNFLTLKKREYVSKVYKRIF